LKRGLLVAAGWAWAATIVWLSLTPSPPTVEFEASDKLGHFGAYLLLMLWFCLLYRALPSRVAYGIVFVAMGVALEIVQGALGYRAYELADMAANGFGVAAGWAAAALAPRILAR
jgi:VanZ family protein